MMKATEARAKVEAIKAVEMADLKNKAMSLCECYGNNEIKNAVSNKMTEVKILHIPTKLMPYIVEIFKENGYEVEENKVEIDTIVVKW